MGSRHEQVVLVDESGRDLGAAPKLDAHRPPGQLHLAVSAWLVDGAGRALVQRRARTKYHFAGRWSNACCTHPCPGEPPADAIARRVAEELGLEVLMRPVGRFLYRAADPGSSFVEHELDHVFVGVVRGTPRPDPSEVGAIAYVEPDVLRRAIVDPARSGRVTPWLGSVMSLAESGVDASRSR
jgi:isopentenyl-diphosphate delta-isomerase